MIHPVSPGGPPSRPHAPRVPNKPTSRPPKAPASVTLDARGSAGAARRFVAKSKPNRAPAGARFRVRPDALCSRPAVRLAPSVFVTTLCPCARSPRRYWPSPGGPARAVVIDEPRIRRLPPEQWSTELTEMLGVALPGLSPLSESPWLTTLAHNPALMKRFEPDVHGGRDRTGDRRSR